MRRFLNNRLSNYNNVGDKVDDFCEDCENRWLPFSRVWWDSTEKNIANIKRKDNGIFVIKKILSLINSISESIKDIYDRINVIEPPILSEKLIELKNDYLEVGVTADDKQEDLNIAIYENYINLKNTKVDKPLIESTSDSLKIVALDNQGESVFIKSNELGKVKSVNNKKGDVILKTSDLENDSDYTTNLKLNQERDERISGDNLKLDKPITSGTTTTHPNIVGVDDLGNSAKLKATDFGKVDTVNEIKPDENKNVNVGIDDVLTKGSETTKSFSQKVSFNDEVVVTKDFSVHSSDLGANRIYVSNVSTNKVEQKTTQDYTGFFYVGSLDNSKYQSANRISIGKIGNNGTQDIVGINFSYPKLGSGFNNLRLEGIPFQGSDPLMTTTIVQKFQAKSGAIALITDIQDVYEKPTNWTNESQQFSGLVDKSADATYDKVMVLDSSGKAGVKDANDFGRVKSVNGKEGDVILKTSDLTNDSNFTTETYVDSEVNRVIDINTSGILGSINPITNVSLLEDGVYRAEVSGTYSNAGNIVVKEGYYTLLRKTTSDWNLESEVKMPISEVDQEFDSNSENAQGGKAISDFLFDKNNSSDFESVKDITVQLGREFKSGAIVASSDTDFYLVPIDLLDVYIDSLVGQETNRRAVYAFNSNKVYIGGAGSFISNFLNDNTLTEKKVIKKSDFTVNGVAYIGFANLKTNKNVGCFIIPPAYGKIKKSLINTDITQRLQNLIPNKKGDIKRNKVVDNNGNITDLNSYSVVKINTDILYNKIITLNLTTSYSFYNLYDSGNNFIKSVSIASQSDVQVDLSKELNVKYIEFSIYNPDGHSSKFFYDIIKGKNSLIFNFLDYAGFNLKSSLSQSGQIQKLVDDIHAIGGGTIYFPAGEYRTVNPVILKSKVNIIGDGYDLTIFKPMGRNSCFIGGNPIDSSTALNDVTYSDFQIDGELQTLGGTPYSSDIKGIYIVFLKNATFRNLLIKNTGATGLGCDFFQSGLIENVRAINCGRLVDLNASSAPGASGIGIGTGAFMQGIETLTISNCHALNCGQNGIFIERQYQSNVSFETDHPVGTMVIGCTARGCRIGFGVSGNDNLVFIGCTAYGNHHANYAYDIGTMNRTGSFGKFVKFIGCISKKAGKFMPENYPLYSGDVNGYGWYIKGNYDGIELTNCDSTESLKDGFFVKAGIKNLYINGGRFAENSENGINLNGLIDRFKISPSVVENNTLNGLRINGNMSNGLLKDFISTSNKEYGVNKISGTLTNVIVKDLLAYSNTLGQLNNITLN